MNLRFIKLIVWHKTKKAFYEVLAIDWNTATIDLIIQDSTRNRTAPKKLPFESIDSVILSEIRFIS